MALKLFWVKYLYVEAHWSGYYSFFNKTLPGKWEENEIPRDSFCKGRDNFKHAYKRVRCKSKDDLYEELFNYEHKRQNHKCFIWILRYVELPIKNGQISAILFEVHYNVVLFLDRSMVYKPRRLRSEFEMIGRLHSAGHVGVKDMEIIVFKKSDVPSEDNLKDELLKKLPAALEYTTIQITKILRHYPT